VILISFYPVLKLRGNDFVFIVEERNVSPSSCVAVPALSSARQLWVPVQTHTLELTWGNGARHLRCAARHQRALLAVARAVTVPTRPDGSVRILLLSRHVQRVQVLRHHRSGCSAVREVVSLSIVIACPGYC
jgi:hypothetical protein